MRTISLIPILHRLKELEYEKAVSYLWKPFEELSGDQQPILTKKSLEKRKEPSS